MIYTMRAGVDNRLKEKLARSLLYGTGVAVAALIAIAPFTGNNTFWNGGNHEKGNTNGTTSAGTSLNATTSSSKSTKNTSTTTKTAPSSTPAPQAAASSLTGSAITQPAGGSTPVVGRGGEVTPPEVITPAPVILPPVTTTPEPPTDTPTPPVTVCTPTVNIDPLLAVDPLCVN